MVQEAEERMHRLLIEQVTAQYPDAIDYLLDAKKDLEEADGLPQRPDCELLVSIDNENVFYFEDGALRSQFNMDGAMTIAMWFPASKKGRRPGYWEVNVSEY